jgi:hypothetical protein
MMRAFLAALCLALLGSYLIEVLSNGMTVRSLHYLVLAFWMAYLGDTWGRR